MPLKRSKAVLVDGATCDLPSTSVPVKAINLPAAAPQSIKGYRPDVDGLRAVAVLGVVLFHLSPRLVPGGFAGVDIFFVISGYLISGILFKEHAADRFSFKEFYGRRIRRLGPALFVVLVACLAYGWFFLLGGEYKSLGRHTAVSSLFGSNILLFKEVDYFGPTAEEKPLLHLWSLGIEEQFYLFWPFLVWLAWNRLPRLTAPLLIAIGFSFAACVVTTSVSPEAAFYLPHTRYWELLVGALLAYRERRGAPSSASGTSVSGVSARGFLAWSGVALITIAFYFLNNESVFPGWWAAVPVAGSAVLIAAGPSTPVNRLVIGNRLMAYIGTLAYPIYLWHWPLHVLVYLGEPTRVRRVLAVVVTMVLAWITKVLVEDPLRFGVRSKGDLRYATASGLLVALLAVGVLGFVIDRADGFPSRYPAELRRLANYAGVPTPSVYLPAMPSCFLRAGQDAGLLPAACAGTGPAGAASRVLLWGDSYANHLDDGLRELANERKFVLAEYSASACPPLVASSALRLRCRTINDFVLARITEFRPQTVVLAGNWMLYGDVVSQQISHTVQAAKSAGVSHIIIVGPLPVWPTALPAMLARRAFRNRSAVPSRLANDSLQATRTLDRLMGDLAAREGVDYASLTHIVCSLEETCLTLVPDAGLAPMQFDIGHLTSEGSRYVVRAMATHIPIP
jgi:peptidoglycan/LPS O-acetylase OafA/YrhL